MQDFYSFSPLLKPETRHIYPVFIPFVGCRKRCVFCAQTLQTGRQAPASEQIEADLRNYLRAVGPSVSPDSELAFFGGTFTLLPQNLQRRLLELGGAVKSGGAELGEVCKGRFTALRCSTRPDAVSSVQLALLREYGVKTIELGVQSFDERSLRASDRGYAGENAFDACARVIKEGFELVVQLMPGMPGQSADAFRKDIERVVGLGPRAVRLYPCVVIEGTELARRWRAEEYRPWSLERTVDELSFALLRLNLAGIPVIRLGLAPEAELLPNILAGPWHPALGNMVQGRALFRWIEEQVRRLPAPLARLTLPRRLQGLFWGHKGELESEYQAISIPKSKVTFWDRPIVKFTTSDYN